METRNQNFMDVKIEKEEKEFQVEIEKVKQVTDKDYRNLDYKLQINDIELINNKSLKELVIQDKMDSLSNVEIENILNNQF